jgi:hypothetical protein
VENLASVEAIASPKQLSALEPTDTGPSYCGSRALLSGQASSPKVTPLGKSETAAEPYSLGLPDMPAPGGDDAPEMPLESKPSEVNLASDCEHLPAMELRRKYPGEATSHRNMLQRRTTRGATVHPDLIEFRSFLRIVGAKPTRHHTIDRIDNTDPEYAPGKVRWARS